MVILALIVVSPLGLAVLAQKPAYATNPVPNTFFAMTVNGLVGSAGAWPVPVSIGTLGKTDGTDWHDLEPSNGTFVWAPLDNSISRAKAVGITSFMYSFYNTPQWASSNPSQSCSLTAKSGVTGCAAPPTNINDWNRFVTALVTRYRGEIQYYEPWNEPDVPSEYSGSMSEMVLLAQSLYNIVKATDPSAQVLTPSVSVGGVLSANPACGSSTCWLAAYLAAGGGAYADGFDFHGKNCPASNSICVQNGISCPTTAIQECAGASLITQIDDARAIMANNGVSGMPLIDTEGGYSDDEGANQLYGASADQQAAYVSRFFIIQASENIQIAVWFSWLSGNGLTGFGTPSASAENNQDYQQTYDWLVGSTMDGPCTEDSSSIWTCGLTGSTGVSALIVWSDSAVSYSPQSQYLKYHELNGTTRSVNGAVPIGILPVLLESGAAATSTTSTASSASSTPSSSSTSASSSTSTASTTSSTSRVPEFPGSSIPIALLVAVSVAAASLRVASRRRVRP